MERFARLCEIASPTGEEGAVAAEVRRELEGMGLTVHEDDAALAARAGAGNLLARVEGTGDRWVLMCAHLDTVPHDAPIEVVFEDGVYRSAGDTILGADNKAAVAMLLELAEHCVRNPPAVGLELLFTVAEEQGLRGAAAFDASALRSEFGFVFDHASPIGELVTRAPSHHIFEAVFEGREAHAGIEPESGRSAILAAAAAIGAMELGRVDEESTANVGTILGGTSGNVVPRECRITAEARSLAPARAAELIASMSDACVRAASERACEVDVTSQRVFEGYETPEGSRALRVAEAAVRSRGIEPRRIATGGGSDANVFVAEGLDCLLVANGTEANHTPRETVSQRALEEMLEVAKLMLWESALC